jgi:hypothetical protein
MRIAALLALLILLDGCVFTRWQPDGFTSGTFSQSHGAAYVYDAVEILYQPIMLIYDLIRLRFIWDHDGFLFSGLVNTLLHIPAILPGYSHVDTTLPRPF